MHFEKRVCFNKKSLVHFLQEKNPVILNLGIFLPGVCRLFKIWGFLSQGFFSPGFGDFLKSGDFYPRDWGFLSPGYFSPGIGDFFKSGDFYPRGLGIFENLEIFIPGIFLG